MAIRGSENSPFARGTWDQMLEDAVEDALQSEIRKRIDIIAKDVVSRRFAIINSAEALIPSAEAGMLAPSSERRPSAGAEMLWAAASPEAQSGDRSDAPWQARIEAMLDRRLDEQITRGAYSEFLSGAETAPRARMRSAELLASLTARGSELLAAGVDSPERRFSFRGIGGTSEFVPSIAANSEMLAEILGSGKPVIGLVSPEMLSGLLTAEAAPIAVVSAERLSALSGSSAKAPIALMSAEMISRAFAGAEAAPLVGAENSPFMGRGQFIPIALVSPELLELKHRASDHRRFSDLVKEVLEKGDKAEARRLVFERGLEGLDEETRKLMAGSAKGGAKDGKADIKR